MSTPSSVIRVYGGVPLDNTYRNVINGGITESSLGGYQIDYWTGQTWCRINGQTNNKVRVGLGSDFSDKYLNANYISIENIGGGTAYKTIFGFITNVLYINDNVVEFTFEIDVFHSFYNSYEFCECMVERATPDVSWVADSYSLPDYFEETEYITMAKDDWTPTGDNLILACYFAPPKGRTYATTDTPIPDTGIMTGFLTGCYVFGFNAYNTTQADIDNFRAVLNTCYKSYHLDCINAVVMPTVLYNSPSSVFKASSPGNINNVNSWISLAVDGNYMNGVTIKNKKMFTYPYTFLEVTNNLGDCKRFAWEGWSGLAPEFAVRAVSVPSPAITLIPRFYFGKDYDFENAITIDNFPSMPVQADTIGTWIAQNSTSSAIKGLGATASGAITGAMVGGIPGAIVGGVLGAAGAATDYVANYEKANNTPSKMTPMSGSGSPLILPQIEKLGFTFRAKCLRGEALRSIDDYFTRYGVAENRLELPPISRSVRGNYIYIKTSGCTIKGNKGDGKYGMPVWAERKICEIHDNGVTYWDSLSNVGSY